MSIELHPRNPSSYVPPVTKKLGLERYSNRPHRGDRPFGFDGYDEHVGFNHYDRVEQEWSQRERKRVKKEEVVDSEKCDLNQVPPTIFEHYVINPYFDGNESKVKLEDEDVYADLC